MSEAEAFLILDGTMSYPAGSMLYRLSAGYFIYLLKVVPHGFRVTGNLTRPIPCAHHSDGINGLVGRGRHAGDRGCPDWTSRPVRGGDTAVE
jgi:hypothetical protein